MDESAAASLALDAAQVLKGISSDVSEVKEVSLEQLRLLQEWTLAHPAEVEQPAEDEVQALSVDDWQTVVEVSNEPPATFYGDLMGYQWMQAVLLVFVLLALFLNLGATLWLSFNRHWRS